MNTCYHRLEIFLAYNFFINKAIAFLEREKQIKCQSYNQNPKEKLIFFFIQTYLTNKIIEIFLKNNLEKIWLIRL